ncbi:MAG TPA: fumarylacetoacetate hydrolase family protein [Gaiellaceae bacterium]|jgi:2-keto-4-pentenoate hydratase/2-oxohepta-3-ene-1,7-dioic acid hydratase in catechol pathway
MRLANVDGRAHLAVNGRLVDVERASEGRLPSDPMALIGRLGELDGLAEEGDGVPVDGARLGPPLPRPSKILACALNYRGHAEEAGLTLPDAPVLFAKLPSALAGPADDLVIPSGRDKVDWEAELVVAIARGGRNIPVAEAWSHVAGLMCGQDVSDRGEQFRSVRQFTLAKSRDSYAPIGPFLVTPDELPNPDDIPVRCLVDGEEVQSSRTSDLIFPVAELVAFLSSWCTLEPGDLIFTGTPGGVGDSREPPRYLRPGNVVETEIEGVGSMRNACVEG